MARVIFLMGVQRSGTNALFKSLSSSAEVRAFNESVDSPWFHELDLRPEAEVRALLEEDPRPVVLKPINETKARSVREVLREWGDHDVRVVWTYRDPVNCYHSHVRRWRGFRGRPEAFARHWALRNGSVIDALGLYGARIAVVRYEDLAVDAAVLDQLSGFLEIPGCYLFRPDRAGGWREVPAQEQDLIARETADVLAHLDRQRRFAARPDPRMLTNRLRRIEGRIHRQIFKLRTVGGG
jgi:hypothetical protein